MTDAVDPSLGSDGQGFMIAQAIKQHGAVGDGWIAASSTAYAADSQNSGISGAPLNAFAKVSESGLDVTFDTGEAFIGGSWVARDTQTTYTLADNTTGQTVYVGWDAESADTVIIGKSGDFTSKDPKIPLYTFDTSSGSVTSETDDRVIGKTTDLGESILGTGSDIARFLMTAAASAAVGTEGSTTNELWRAGSSVSDLVMSIDAGGRANLAWNAYYDGTDWRYIIGSEPAMRLAFETDGVHLYAASGGTADSIITWLDLRFDDGTGDLFIEGTRVYDQSAGEVPQAQLGGPPASLSAYPIPAGDIDDGAGSGLDADLLDGKHASEISTAGEWTPITTHTDTDNTTVMDFDTGVLSTTYDRYKVDVVMESYADISGGNYNEIRCRINNHGASEYHSADVDTAGGVRKTESLAYWKYIARVASSDDTNKFGIGQAELHFQSDVLGVKTDGRFPTVAGKGSGWHESGVLDHGVLASDYATIDQFYFWSVANATGVIQIQGKNY